MKLLPLTLLLTATAGAAILDKKISYLCYYDRFSFDSEHKDGPVVNETLGEEIAKSMVLWSSCKHFAKPNRLFTEVIVSCSNVLDSKELAVEAIAKQERIVKEQLPGQL